MCIIMCIYIYICIYACVCVCAFFLWVWLLFFDSVVSFYLKNNSCFSMRTRIRLHEAEETVASKRRAESRKTTSPRKTLTPTSHKSPCTATGLEAVQPWDVFNARDQQNTQVYKMFTTIKNTDNFTAWFWIQQMADGRPHSYLSALKNLIPL